MTDQIPKLVAERILAARRSTYESNEQMQKRRAERAGEISAYMQKISAMVGEKIEVGECRLVTKPLALDRELRFWAIEDDEELEEFLSGDLLPALFPELTDAEWRSLPPGYRPLTLVLEFERHSQFEGWTAEENRAEDLPEIVRSYRYVGLDGEADALNAVDAAYKQITSDDPDVIHDTIVAAYKSVPNATSEFEDRVPVVLEFVRAHPELFVG